jgi:polysaccharide biosynthesis transport protein
MSSELGTLKIDEKAAPAIDASQAAPSASHARVPGKPLGLAVSPAKLQEALLFRWKSALAVGLVFAGIGVGIAFLTYKPKYTAITTMRMTLSKRLLPGTDDSVRNVEEFQKTEAQMAKSREVLRTALQKDQIRGLSLVRNQEDPLVWLEKELQAWFVTGTDIFRMSLSGEDPEDVTLIVNTVRDVYINQFVNSTKKQQAERFENIVNVMVESEEKIRKQREMLRELAAGLKTGDTQVLTLKQRLVLEEFFERKRELSTLDAEMRRNVALQVVQEAELKAIDNVDPSKLSPAMLEEYLERHPKVQKEQTEVVRLEAQIKEYRVLVTPTSPRLAQLEADLKHAREQVQKAKTDAMPTISKSIQDVVRRQRVGNLEQTQEKLRVAKEQRTTLSEIVVQLGKDAEKIGLGSFEIEVRRTEIEQAEGVLKTLRGEKERLEIEKFNNRENVIAKHDAEVPTVNQASLPKTGAMYGLAGFLLGILGVSYLEARVHRLHKAAQVEQELGIQTLGVLPLLGAKGRGYGKAMLASDSIPDLLFADAINSLCARLLCDDRLHKDAIIMVTSATEAEGKTMLATHLAVALAHSGHRTL